MIEIRFLINGREIDPRNPGDALRAAVLKTVQEGIRQKLSQIICPVHHQRPRVTAAGASFEHLEFTIEGCCAQLKDEARRALAS